MNKCLLDSSAETFAYDLSDSPMYHLGYPDTLYWLKHTLVLPGLDSCATDHLLWPYNMVSRTLLEGFMRSTTYQAFKDTKGYIYTFTTGRIVIQAT
jgi:hypothetical protein